MTYEEIKKILTFTFSNSENTSPLLRELMRYANGSITEEFLASVIEVKELKKREDYLGESFDQIFCRQIEVCARISCAAEKKGLKSPPGVWGYEVERVKEVYKYFGRKGTDVKAFASRVAFECLQNGCPDTACRIIDSKLSDSRRSEPIRNYC